MMVTIIELKTFILKSVSNRNHEWVSISLKCCIQEAACLYLSILNQTTSCDMQYSVANFEARVYMTAIHIKLAA